MTITPMIQNDGHVTQIHIHVHVNDASQVNINPISVNNQPSGCQK